MLETRREGGRWPLAVRLAQTWKFKFHDALDLLRLLCSASSVVIWGVESLMSLGHPHVQT